MCFPSDRVYQKYIQHDQRPEKTKLYATTFHFLRQATGCLLPHHSDCAKVFLLIDARSCVMNLRNLWIIHDSILMVAFHSNL